MLFTSIPKLFLHPLRKYFATSVVRCVLLKHIGNLEIIMKFQSFDHLVARMGLIGVGSWAV